MIAPDYVCSVCGGSDVRILNWTNPNTREVADGEDYYEPEGDGVYRFAAQKEQSWCDECQAHQAVRYTGTFDIPPTE